MRFGPGSHPEEIFGMVRRRLEPAPQARGLDRGESPPRASMLGRPSRRLLPAPAWRWEIDVNPRPDAPKRKYEKPAIIHVERIEVRAVVCAKTVGDDFCETNAPVTS
jgi:hypothetical protein